MKFVIDLLSAVLSIVLSNILFCMILNALNKSALKLFVPLQKLAINLKGNKLYQNTIFVISIFICVTIKDIFTLNYIEFGIVIGFFTSLSDVIFETGLGAKKKLIV